MGERGHFALGLSVLLAALTAPAAEPLALRGVGAVRGVAFSPDGKLIACGGDDATVRVIETSTNREVRRLMGHRSVIEAVAFAPEGTLATAGRDRVMRLWNAATGEVKGELPGHRIGVTSLAFSGDGVLVSGGHDGTVRIWDWKSSKELRRLEDHEADVRAVAVSADGGRIASASYDRTVRLWDAKTGKQLRLFVTMKREATAVAITPDGRRVAGGGAHGQGRLWDADTGSEAVELVRAAGLFSCLACSADGRMLAGADGYAESVVVWESHTGAVRRVIPLTVRVLALAFSRDGQRLALARGDSSVQVERFTARQPVGDLAEVWERLPTMDGEAAFDAILGVADEPARGRALLRKQLRPAPAVEEKRLRSLLVELESDDFAIREGATRQLEVVGESAAELLRKTMQEGKLSVDARARVERILRPVDSPVLSGERLRITRAVECLERMGTPEARQFLSALAKGATGAFVTEQARAAVARFPR